MRITLTDREADIMAVLWERGPSTVAEVRAQLTDDLAHTTVLTILRILESKGYVSHEGEGRAHRFTALVERDVARRSALQQLASKLFEGSTRLLLTHLVADEKLTASDFRRLQRLINDRKRKQRS